MSDDERKTVTADELCAVIDCEITKQMDEGLDYRVFLDAMNTKQLAQTIIAKFKIERR